jgi:hypothetical protein
MRWYAIRYSTETGEPRIDAEFLNTYQAIESGGGHFGRTVHELESGGDLIRAEKVEADPRFESALQKWRAHDPAQELEYARESLLEGLRDTESSLVDSISNFADPDAVKVLGLLRETHAVCEPYRKDTAEDAEAVSA